jgi:hypothetical protein
MQALGFLRLIEGPAVKVRHIQFIFALAGEVLGSLILNADENHKRLFKQRFIAEQ